MGLLISGTVNRVAMVKWLGSIQEKKSNRRDVKIILLLFIFIPEDLYVNDPLPY